MFINESQSNPHPNMLNATWGMSAPFLDGPFIFWPLYIAPLSTSLTLSWLYAFLFFILMKTNLEILLFRFKYSYFPSLYWLQPRPWNKTNYRMWLTFLIPFCWIGYFLFIRKKNKIKMVIRWLRFRSTELHPFPGTAQVKIV